MRMDRAGVSHGNEPLLALSLRPMSADELACVAFGDFEFDLASGELRRGDSTNRLAPQSASVLALLVRRQGDVVTRAELRERFAPDTNVEFDQGLNFCIRQLRIALSDDAAEPEYIETLHRRGYRFVAPVLDRRRSAFRAGESMPLTRIRRRPVVVGAVLVALVAVVAVFVSTRPQAADPRLAVLAFDAASTDSALGSYRRQLVEALVTAAGRGQFDKIAVMGPSFTSRFTGKSTPPDTIRAALGATHILSGGLSVTEIRRASLHR